MPSKRKPRLTVPGARTVTKAELTLEISARTEMPASWTAEIIRLFMDGVTEALAGGKKVTFRGFGVFAPVVRRPRLGRNPDDPASAVSIPERAAVRFRPGRELAAAVEKLTEQAVEASPKQRRQPRARQTA